MEEEYDPRTGKYIRLTLGGLFVLVGIVFLLIPFIPLGYLFILIGLFFLSPVIPALSRFIERLEEKDKKERVKKAREKADKVERHIHRRVRKFKKK
jgi:uncharacterized membrane protein HdeD (DUF308 family)